MAVAAPLLVPTPAPLAPRHGLLSVATLIDDPSGHWVNGVEYDASARPKAVADPLEPCTAPDDAEVDEGLPTVIDGAYRVWTGVECKLPGRTREEFEAYARAQLAAGESAAVERAVWDTGENPIIPAASLPAGDDPLSLAAGLGALEAWLYETYAGTGVLHIARRAVPLLASEKLIKVDGGVLRTVLGTPVAAGAYPGGTVGPDDTDPVAAGQLWIAVTPAVSYRRSQIVYRATFDHRSNTETVIAERYMLPSWEALSAAALITVEA